MRPFASRATRLLGQLIDGIVGAVPLVLCVFFASFDTSILIPLYWVAVAWVFFYYLFADAFPGGQSLAKRWLGMQVVDATTGAPCTFMQSFIRNLLLAVLGPFAWIFIFGERYQRLGDKAAGTIVVVG